MHQPAPKLPPATEARRVATLHEYGVLDTPREAVFDDITRIASAVCDTPISVINLIDSDRQWFKAEIGLGVRETPLATSICAHAILEHDFLEVPDTTMDSRFNENPLVTGQPSLRFYAGALLKTPDGQPLGTVCVLDTTPRTLTPAQVSTLRALARQVMAQLELRRMLAESQALAMRRARVLATVGHDLKSPLRSAMYALNRARSEPGPEQAVRLESAAADLQLIEQKFGELVASATGVAGVSAPALTSTPIQSVFDSVQKSWNRAAQRKDIALTLAATSHTARTNASLLETLLGNLVSNAIKYTPRGGSVELRSTGADATTTIEVADNGMGMDQEKVEGYFNAFQQEDTSSEGLGVGLWIVRQTATALEATVDISSRLGAGTRIAVVLPADQQV